MCTLEIVIWMPHWCSEECHPQDNHMQGALGLSQVEQSFLPGQEAVPFSVRRTAQRVLKAMGTGAMGWPVYGGGAATGKQHLPLAQACPSCHDSCPQELWPLLQARLYLHNRKSNVWSLPNTRAMSQRWKVGKRGFDLLAGGCLRRSLGQALVLEQCLSLC